MQAVFQKYTDNAVSKTVNFPANATVPMWTSVYLMAFDEGLKGITIYRDGCKADQPMSTGKAEVKPEAAAVVHAPPKPVGPRERAKVTTGFTEKDQHRLRQHLHHRQLRRHRHLRGLLPPGQDRRLRHRPTGKHLPPGVLSPEKRHPGGLRRQAAERHPLPLHRLGRRQERPVLRRRHRHGAGELRGAGHQRQVDKTENSGNGNGNGHGEKKVIKDFGLVKNIAGQCVECGSILVYQEGCFICPGCGFTKC